MTAPLTGTWRLVRLALRRDRVLLPAWVLAVTGVAAAVVASVVGLYRTAEERAAAAAFSAGNPIARAFDGPASGTDIGAMAWVEAAWLLAVLTGLMCAQVVVRHSRLEEETGRAEMIGAAVVGRHARLAAALEIACLAGALTGLGVTLALVTNGLDPGSSLLAGAGIATVGWVFAGVAAVTSQLSATARGANGMAGAALGAAFLLRAVGDATGRVGEDGVTVVSAWLSWASPIGWVQQLRPFAEDHVALLAAPLVLATLLTLAAVLLESRRDLGSGAVQPRPGPARGRPALLRPLGLAWRLQRGSLLAFTLGAVVLGATFGAVGESAGDLVDTSEGFASLLATTAPDADIIDLYIAFAVGLLAIAVSAFAVQSLLRLRTEELSGRAEGLLATALSRWRWVGGHLVISTAGTALLLSMLGAAGALAYGVLTGEWHQGSDFLWASIAYVPAALVLLSFVLVAVTFVPVWAPALAWGALSASLVLDQFGEQLELPQLLLNLSPFAHVPSVPAEPGAVLPLLLLSVAAIALAGTAMLRIQTRDLVLAV